MYWPRLITALSLFIFGASAFAAADLHEGLAALQHRDYRAALQIFMPLAENGNALAQFQLGMMYASGRGVARDYKAAARWLEKAALQGDARAENNLGSLYDQGRGVAQNPKQAARWYREAAEHGNAAARVNLASLYLAGRGVKPNSIEAFAWASAAAQVGEPGAEQILRSAASRMTPAQITQGQNIASMYRDLNSAG